ncbi:unnamed protein product [Cyclocybe aegerita]|uniref:Uncharacterized protein n=1 Tax=Cyclocybe aegerita TaxID=1973307 RepID=A0A8S0VSM7_CYCAE|nr:unnamed protein product [Cyclocybe aegerita]
MPDFFKEHKDKANIQAHYANLHILGPSAPSSTSQISSRNALADEELILQWLSKLEEEPDNADTDDKDSSDADLDLEPSPFNSTSSSLVTDRAFCHEEMTVSSSIGIEEHSLPGFSHQDGIPKVPTSPTRVREKAHWHHSSFISFSSCLFNRISSPFDENTSMFSRSSNGSSSWHHTNDHASVEEAQAPEPSIPSPPAYRPVHTFHLRLRIAIHQITLHQPLLINLLFTPFPSRQQARVLPLPHLDQLEPVLPRPPFIPSSTFIPSSLQSPLTRKRERPTLIQTMPLPSRSHVSSFSFPYSVPSGVSPWNATHINLSSTHEKDAIFTRDMKADFFLTLEEEPSSITSSAIDVSISKTATVKGRRPFDLVSGVSGFMGEEGEDESLDNEENGGGYGGYGA